MRGTSAQRSAQLFTIERQLAQMSLQLRQESRSDPHTSHRSGSLALPGALGGGGGDEGGSGTHEDTPRLSDSPWFP
jgi:uncharacterized membrane protein YgcG